MKHFLLIAVFAFAHLAGGADAPDVVAPVLQSLVDKQLVAGAVALVADKDKVLVHDVAGFASLKDKTPMRKDAVFWIASMTKPMTAVALMMLVDEGKVSITAPVEKYLPEFKGQMIAGDGKTPAHAPQRPITITDILTHTSGLVSAADKALKREYSLEVNVKNIAAMPLRHEPGMKFDYNNSGIATAGRIIEVVSGMSYYDFMQSRLFGPLGMKDITFWPDEEQAARLAHSARRGEDKKSLEEVHLDKGLTQALIEKLGRGVKVPAPMLADMGMGLLSSYSSRFADPAGGLFSTAGDVGAFCQMLLNGGTHHGRRLLSEESVKVMSAIHTGDVAVNPQEAWGLGWTVKTGDKEGQSVGSYGHRGARRTAMWIDPKNQLAMVILVERFDMPGGEQDEMYGAFAKATIKAYGKAAP
ncbi:MAG: serine hydrolase domain-containing protein [Prosthecobacter sp.]